MKTRYYLGLFLIVLAVATMVWRFSASLKLSYDMMPQPMGIPAPVEMESH